MNVGQLHVRYIPQYMKLCLKTFLSAFPENKKLRHQRKSERKNAMIEVSITTVNMMKTVFGTAYAQSLETVPTSKRSVPVTSLVRQMWREYDP